MKRQPEEVVFFEGWSELPQELWCLILQALLLFVNYEDMISTRLVNKYFLQVMDQKIVPEVPWLRASTLDRFLGEYFAPFSRLPKFTGITHLVLDSLSNGLSDFMLSKMTRLSKLTTNGPARGGFINLPALYSRIDTLYLSADDGYHCLIQPSHLASFTLLNRLSLDNYRSVRDEDLTKLTQLKSLILKHSSNITDTGLGSLTNLTNLRIKSNEQKYNVTSCSVSKLTKLEYLKIPGCHFLKNSLHLLPIVPNLTCLTLSGTAIVRDNVLSQLTNLVILRMGKRNIAFKGEAFLSLTNLKSLRLVCGHHSIIEEKYLALATQLDDLWLINNERITDTTLQSLTLLEYLYLENDNLLTNDSLLHKPRLTQLTISGTTHMNRSTLSLPSHCLLT